MYKLIHITPCISLLRKHISVRGPKAWGLILVEFRRGIFIYESNAELCFSFVNKLQQQEKMLYNLNTNWKCVYIHRKLSLSEA